MTLFQMRQSLLWIALGLVAVGSGLTQGLEQSATSHQAEGAMYDGLCEVSSRVRRIRR